MPCQSFLAFGLSKTTGNLFSPHGLASKRYIQLNNADVLCREAYDMFACNGILFNHESPRRGEHFVTRKITTAAARISLGTDDSVALGNLDAQRDWGHAQDYVLCMWLMLQQNQADDFVIATGVTTTVRKFAELAFQAAGLPVRYGAKCRKTFQTSYIHFIELVPSNRWEGSGIDEKGIVISGPKQDKVVIEVDARYFRPTEVDLLLGDPTKAKNLLGWDPSATSLQVLF